MLRSVFVAAAAAVLLAVGALSALAGNAHGKAGSTLATSTTLKGEATSELKSTAARPNANAAPAAQAQAQTQTQVQAETGTDTADEATAEDADDATEANDDQAATAPAAAPAVRTEQEGSGQDD
jgi:hypothetical protein